MRRPSGSSIVTLLFDGVPPVLTTFTPAAFSDANSPGTSLLARVRIGEPGSDGRGWNGVRVTPLNSRKLMRVKLPGTVAVTDRTEPAGEPISRSNPASP